MLTSVSFGSCDEEKTRGENKGRERNARANGREAFQARKFAVSHLTDLTFTGRVASLMLPLVKGRRLSLFVFFQIILKIIPFPDYNTYGECTEFFLLHSGILKSQELLSLLISLELQDAKARVRIRDRVL